MFGNSNTKLHTAFTILKEQRLVVEVLSGTVTLESLKAYKAFQARCDGYSPDFDILMVAKNTVFDFLLSEVHDYFEFVKKSQVQIAGNRIGAVVVDTPNQQVYVSNFKSISAILPQSFSICDNLDDAISHLGKLAIKEDIKQLVKDLEKHPTHGW